MINEQLEGLYHKQFDRFLSQLSLRDENAYSYPLLLKINEEKWLSADVKIMVFGQETVGWGDHKNENSIEFLMDLYHNFYYQLTTNKVRTKSPFFKGFTRIIKLLKKHPDYKDKTVEVLWNNINKVGKYFDTGVINSTRQIERKCFNVILDEVNILQPDLVIFFTGPHRDGDIQFNFPDAVINRKETEPLGHKRRIGKYAWIEGYPFKAIRLYHPASFGNCTNDYLRYAINDWLLTK